MKKRWIALSALSAIVIVALACGGGETATPTPTSVPIPTPVGTPPPTQAGVNPRDADTPCPTARIGPEATATPGVAIDQARAYQAVIKTEKGDIVVELFAQDAPVTVNNFVHLARCGYYDGITFHRVLPNFMVQTGDPMGTGSGGPGYTIPDEISARLHTGPGVLSMAKTAAPNTGGSQFFITHVATPHLDGVHTVFGQVIEGLDVVNSIRVRNPSTDPNPGDRIITIEIVEK